MKISAIPKKGRKDSLVYVNSRHGKVARQYVRPRNPRTAAQQGHRQNVRAVSARWRTLIPEQRGAWRVAAAKNHFADETGRRVRLNEKLKLIFQMCVLTEMHIPAARFAILRRQLATDILDYV